MKEHTKSIAVIAVANGLNSLAYGLSIPFFAIYLNAHKGVPASVVGIMLALAMGVTAIGSAISGEASDIFGRKRVMVFALTLRSAAMFAMAAAMFLNAHYFWAMAFHFIGSFVGSFFRTASNAWIADNTPPAGRVRAFGIMRIGLNLGWSLGPALGGLLAKASYSLGFALTACTYLVTLFFVSRHIRESLPKITERKKANFVRMLLDLKDGNLARLCCYEFLISMVLSQLVVGLSLHAVNRLGMSENMVGLFFTIQGLVVVLFQYNIGVITSKMRLTTVLAAGCLLYAVGFGSIGFMASFAGIALGVILSAAGEMFVLPAGHSLTSNIAPENKKGRYLGLYILANTAGQGAGILMAGVFMEHLSPQMPSGPWLIVGALGLASGLLFFSLNRRIPAEQNNVNLRQATPIIKQIPS
ncbi:MAG: MFS transporter [Elusimicrobiota bacterium]|jgi:MFS family permease|nr:MFS transporter [Elusimicrobiota bacterium]